MTSNRYAPETRVSLILRLRNPDDLKAWGEFVEIYQPVIHYLATRRGLQKADADDVTQEVLARVARKIKDWDPDPGSGSFRAWLATVTRNQTIQSFRQRQRRPGTGVNSRIDQMADEDTDGRLQRQFDLEQDRQLFAWAARQVQSRFEPKTWQAFWLTAVDGLDVPVVARQLETSKAQVYVARSRVMSALRQAIQRSGFDPDE